jgi:hypothetical protein
MQRQIFHRKTDFGKTDFGKTDFGKTFRMDKIMSCIEATHVVPYSIVVLRSSTVHMAAIKPHAQIAEPVELERRSGNSASSRDGRAER